MSDSFLEIPLEGGNVNSGVVKVKDTVRRATNLHSPSVHRLLKHLENKKFFQAPRFLGIDEKGREILTYLPGSSDFPDDLWQSDAGLVAAAEMLRDYHEAASSYRSQSSDSWAFTYHDTSRCDTICHNDFAPYNMVFENGIPVGIIDFDLAGPGPAIRDIAYLAYWFAPLSFASDDLRDLAQREVAAQCPRLKQICTICGVDDRETLLEMVSEVLHHMGSEVAASAMVGPEVAGRLKDGGHFEHWCREAKAFDANRDALASAIGAAGLMGPDHSL